MQIVIDIPEETYKFTQERFAYQSKDDPHLSILEVACVAIKNGTPLETVTEFADRCRECGREKVLDKIRVEIAEYKDDKVIHAERNEMIDIVLEIIDKYRAEGEQVGNPDRLEGEDKE